MPIKRILPAALSILFLISGVIIASGRNTEEEKVMTQEPMSITVKKPTEEIRGLWVTYMALDVEEEADHEAAFHDKVDTIVQDMIDANLNTMIVQVRPFCDAMYPSKYFPWSHILTGTQGQDPGFDPLAYIIQQAHDNNIMVHAWVNPYRISTKDTPSSLSDDHPYVKDKAIGVTINNGVYLNPSSDDAITLITNGVTEIVKNYDVDGIQFDDYFYPPDCGDFDSEDYAAYCDNTEDPLSIADYRKENVNRMIASVYRGVHETKPNVLFGVSPQGNMANNEELYADVQKWCAEKGYIDYICPQIYFSLDNPALTFEDGLQDWIDTKKHDGLSLYVGLPAYKAGTDADSGTWLDNSDILKTEIRIVRDSGADGFMLYSSDSFHNEDNEQEIQNVIRYLTSSPSQ